MQRCRCCEIGERRREDAVHCALWCCPSQRSAVLFDARAWRGPALAGISSARESPSGSPRWRRERHGKRRRGYCCWRVKASSQVNGAAIVIIDATGDARRHGWARAERAAATSYIYIYPTLAVALVASITNAPSKAFTLGCAGDSSQGGDAEHGRLSLLSPFLFNTAFLERLSLPYRGQRVSASSKS